MRRYLAELAVHDEVSSLHIAQRLDEHIARDTRNLATNLIKTYASTDEQLKDHVGYPFARERVDGLERRARPPVLD